MNNKKDFDDNWYMYKLLFMKQNKELRKILL